MERIKLFLKSHQQPLVLLLGYLLVAGISFGLGRLTTSQTKPPEIKLEQVTESDALPSNYTPTVSGAQSPNPTGKCVIKGTASSHIYHMPGQSGYDKLNTQTCFETEERAQAAGFRKALR